MKVVKVIIVCLLLCTVDYTSADDEFLASDHSLTKRQAQDIHSPSLPRRDLISPSGQPYFKYQPPVSSGRETLPGRQGAPHGLVPGGREATARVRIGGAAGGRQATTQVKIGGAAGGSQSASSGNSGAPRNGTSNPFLGRSRGRTYKYPFGKERVQYTGSQSQGYTNETQAGRENNGGHSPADSQQDTLVQQQQQQQQQQQRYNPLYGRPAQHTAGNSQNDSSHDSPNQGVSSAAAQSQEQELQRRHDELRRRHEEERRRQEEERRRLLEERRKKSEERRRLYYEQQQQRANQQRGYGQNIHSNLTGSQQSGYQGNRQQGATTTTNTQQRVANSNPLSQQYAQRTDTSSQEGNQQAFLSQQSSSSSSQQRGRLPQVQQPGYDGSRHGGPQPQQPAYSGSQQGGYLPQRQQSAYSGSQQAGSQPQQTFNSHSQQSGYLPQRQQPDYSGSQQGGYSPHHQQSYSGSHQQGSQPQQPIFSGSQQSGYLPQTQQSAYNDSHHGGYSPQHQQTAHSSVQRNSLDHQAVFRLNNTHSTNVQSTPQQSAVSQVYYQQPGHVDPRLQTAARSNLSSPTSSRDYAGQGQGQRYPQPGANLGSSFSFEQQDTDSDCPDKGIDLRINGLDCQQAVQQFGAYLCYTHEFTSRDCCHVCRPRKQAHRTGCEYGDHAELCSSISPADCYDLRNRYSCCETCERLKRHHLPAGCEYGDMTTRCDNVRQNPGLCYVPDNQRLCCETCNQIRNLTNTGCPWGDYHSNLCQLFEENTSNVRINCYSKQRQKLCCQSCERLRDWIPAELPADCQYGDRPVIFSTTEFGRLNCSSLFSHFSVDECRINEAVATNCCHTCHRLLHHRG